MALYEEKKKETEDYYQMLKDENYKTLLDSQIQLDNARQRALKSTNQALSSMGMDSSGYAGTYRNGIESQYLAGLQSASDTYQKQRDYYQVQEKRDLNSLAEAEEQRIEAEKEKQEQKDAEAQAKLEAMQQQNKEYILNVLADETLDEQRKHDILANFGTFDSDGKFIMNENVNSEDLTDAYLNAYVTNNEKDLAELNEEKERESTTNVDLTGKTGAIWYTRKGDEKIEADGINEGWEEEAKVLQTYLSLGKVSPGTYIVLNNNPNRIFMYYDENKNLVYANPDDVDGKDVLLIMDDEAMEKKNYPVIWD